MDFVHTSKHSAAAGTVNSPPAGIGVRDIQLYQSCDNLSGIILLMMAVLSPWLFGTTQPEVIRGMNFAGAVLWLLLISKWSLRTIKQYRPATWDSPPDLPRLRLIRALALVTAALLSYMLISVINARADWDYDTQTLQYRSALPWLPHSYDQGRSLQLLANYAALAGFFWALWDWLRGKTIAEQRADRRTPPVETSPRLPALPSRLRILLWLLCWSGGLLALQAIIQRQTGTTKLLWLVTPRIYPEGAFHFGPFAYRANGAQYLNLLWPVCLGFWWTLQRVTHPARWHHHLLLPLGALMVAGAFISSSKAGALIAGGMMLGSAGFLAGTSLLFPERPQQSWRTRMLNLTLLAACIGVIVLLIAQFGWASLSQRLVGLDSGFEGREQIFATARRMTADFPWFGCGPGTFVAMFPLYRSSSDEFWPAQLHNDWLETQITFGWIGLGLILLAFALVLARRWCSGGIPAGRQFTGLLWQALAGALIHARFDFPFQIYSILMLALIWCAVLFTLSRRP